MRRSGVANKYHDLIMVTENCIPVEHKAHVARGNSGEAKDKCAWAMLQRLSPASIGEWYASLWQDHDLSVDKGMLVPPKYMKVRQLIPLIELGAQLDGVDLPEEGWECEGQKGTYDVRAQIALRFQGKRRQWKESLPDKHNGHSVQQLHTWIDDGHWARYVMRATGTQRPS